MIDQVVKTDLTERLRPLLSRLNQLENGLLDLQARIPSMEREIKVLRTEIEKLQPVAPALPGMES